ncbi:MAG: hypothetical protein IJA04_08355 [Bacteroidaceae bacterium]|nr:hypothetical protein [Bacteroidaceae bacterium]
MANIATSERKKRSLLRFFYSERRLYSREAQIATSERKKRSLLRFFYSERRLYSREAQIATSEQKKRSLLRFFFTASADYIRAKRKLQQASEKYQACLNIFYSERRLYSNVYSNVCVKYKKLSI